MNLRRKRWVIGGLACIATALAGTRCLADTPPSVLDLYRQAIRAMDDVKEPAYVTYRLDSTSQGLRGDFQGFHHCNMYFCISPGNNADHWTLWHRTKDFKTAVLDLNNNRRYVSDLNMFDPTWYGPNRALRMGMLNLPQAASSPLPGASPTPDPSLRGIATVTVFNPSAYQLTDGGNARCPGGDPGRVIHMISRTRNPRHQLSDVIIDLKRTLFCSVRLTLHSGPVGITAYWEGHYGEVGDYWMLTDGLIASTTRILGVKASGGVWNFRLSDMQFPESLPPDTFVPTPVSTHG